MKPTLDHRRHALQLACQLPEDATDALLILDAARELVETFLMPAGTTTDTPALTVVSFNRGDPPAA